MKTLSVVLKLVLVFVTLNGFAQSLPFHEELDHFSVEDSLHPKSPGMIVFTGSSSIRIWKDLETDFPGYPVLNRGFGGSSLTHLIQYAPLVILKYHPKQILIYSGDNDLAADTTVNGKTVFMRMRALTKIIRRGLGDVPILIVSIKPSPSRYHLIDKVMDANRRIKKYCTPRKHINYINVFDAMMGSDHKPRKELFLGDQLHMNRKGYEIWKEIIGPYLLK